MNAGRCGCERGACPHPPAGCPATVADQADGTEAEPVAMFVGAVCPPCARAIAEALPECVTAPYGTMPVTE